MKSSSGLAHAIRSRTAIVIVWVFAAAAIPIWASLNVPGWGWDFHAYADTVRSLQEGHDPYLEAIQTQRDYYSHRPIRSHDFLPRPGHPPLPYLYSPITLPLVRAIGRLPERGLQFLKIIYWLLYAAGALTTLWAVFQFVEEDEKTLFAFAPPAAMFFPGLLQHDVILGGNIAYVLYGMTFGSAAFAWRTGRWTLFYAVVLCCSCFKLPFLLLLAIPLLSARGQGLAVSLMASAGMALFAIQPMIWPAYFHHYLEALSLNGIYLGFGLSPTGLFSQYLYKSRMAYPVASVIFYLLYAMALSGLLLYFSRQFKRGRFSIARWAPVMLIGVLLLNPRLKEYDVAPLTLPLALVIWRTLCSRMANTGQAIACALLTGVNFIVILGLLGENSWNIVASATTIAIFWAGSNDLTRKKHLEG